VRVGEEGGWGYTPQDPYGLFVMPLAGSASGRAQKAFEGERGEPTPRGQTAGRSERGGRAGGRETVPGGASSAPRGSPAGDWPAGRPLAGVTPAPGVFRGGAVPLVASGGRGGGAPAARSGV